MTSPTGRGAAYFRCPQCDRRIDDPNGVAESYCGHCRDWTGKTIEDAVISARTPVLGRVQTGITVIDGQSMVVLTLYAQGATDTVLDRYLLPPGAGAAWAAAIVDTSRKAMEE